MKEFIKFISDQLIKDQYQLTIENNKIIISVNNEIYKEPLFDPNAKFSGKEILDLINISKNFEEININDSLPILKLWFLITHEKYFKREIKLDKFQRVGEENLMPGFHEILKVPIADILRIKLNRILKIKKKKKTSIYYTCDFDILNIWDVWTFKDLIREIIYCLLSSNIIKLMKIISSYFFSRTSEKYNGFLNLDMFNFNEKYKFINIGFFLSDTVNPKYDTIINYNDKPIKKYISKLKDKNILFGLHTNFDTLTNPESISIQNENFKSLFNIKPKLNRHHYLRFHFPNYLEPLDKINIEKDFSLYFPESMLFRSGISSMFKVWNEIEKKPYNTNLIPTTIMDGTFTDYLKCDYSTALSKAKLKLNLAIQFGNDIVLLWHNSTTYKYSNTSQDYHNKLIKNIKIHLYKCLDNEK